MAKTNDGRSIDTSIVSSTLDVSVSVSDPATLEVLAADATFELNLKAAIAETISVDPKTV